MTMLYNLYKPSIETGLWFLHSTQFNFIFYHLLAFSNILLHFSTKGCDENNDELGHDIDICKMMTDKPDEQAKNDDEHCGKNNDRPGTKQTYRGHGHKQAA